MKYLGPGLAILLVTSTMSSEAIYAQSGSSREVGVSRAEEPDVPQIKQKAKVDAASDSDLQKNDIWCGTSIILSWGASLLQRTYANKTDNLVNFGVLAGLAALPIAAYLAEVKLPENREKDLSSESREYQEIYRSEYTSEVKRQRVKYSLVGPVIIGAIATIQMGWSLVRPGRSPDSENGDSEDG